MVKTIATVVCGMLLVGATNASAQGITWTDKAFVNFSLGFQPKSQDVKTDAPPKPLYDETATTHFEHKIDGGGMWDLTGGYFVRKNIGAAVSFSGRSKESDATFTSSVPNPAIFDQPRAVTGTVPGLKYSENWFAILGVYAIPVTDKVDVFLLGGPAVATVKEDVLVDATYAEGASGPVVTPRVENHKKSFWGAQFGVDVRYLFTKNIGAGMFLRGSTASGTLVGDVKPEPGGFQIGFGVRARF